MGQTSNARHKRPFPTKTHYCKDNGKGKAPPGLIFQLAQDSEEETEISDCHSQKKKRNRDVEKPAQVWWSESAQGGKTEQPSDPRAPGTEALLQVRPPTKLQDPLSVLSVSFLGLQSRGFSSFLVGPALLIPPNHPPEILHLLFLSPSNKHRIPPGLLEMGKNQQGIESPRQEGLGCSLWEDSVVGPGVTMNGIRMSSTCKYNFRETPGAKRGHKCSELLFSADPSVSGKASYLKEGQFPPKQF